MPELIYLTDDLNTTVGRILADKELQGCNLNEEKILRTLESFQGDEIACSVFYKKYALRNNNNEIEEFTLNEAKNRWAKYIASAETKFNAPQKSENYFKELYEYFLPAGRQMFALGNRYVPKATFTNCYVTKIEEDSLEGIYDAAKKLARTYSYGGGIGLCIGGLRPNKAKVSNSARHSTGAVSFMELFSLTTGLIGQCIAKGERVLTRKGLVAIEHVCEDDEVWTKEGFIKVNNTFKNGKKDIYTLKDEFGYEIRASEDHIFLSEKDGEIIEKRLKHFEIGDPIVLIPGTTNDSKDYIELKNIPYIKKSNNNSNRLNNSILLPKSLDEDLAYVLGYSYGYGSVDYDKFNEPTSLSLACSNDWPKIKEKIASIINKIFGYCPKINSGDGDLENISIHSKIICKFLQDNNLLKQKSQNIIFPAAIIKSKSSVQMAFLAGYFDADGYASGKKKGYIFSSVCYKFLMQAKIVLMANGIISRNHYENRAYKGWRDLHSINITGSFFQNRLVELLSKSVKVCSSKHISKRDRWLTPFKAKTFGIKYSNFAFCPDNSQYLSSNCFEKLKKTGHKLPNVLIKSYVQQIVKNGCEDTYDLSLEKEHVYFCEGFQVHNSGRRGALMTTIPVDHPDIEEFVEIKHNNTDKVKHSNISIKLTNDFMNAVVNGENFTLKYETPHEKVIKTVKARELWNKIIESARDSAEPGLLFWDKAVEMSPSDAYPSARIHSTNPCGEQYLPPGGACTLASLLLHTFVKNPYTEGAYFDFKLFKEMVSRGVRHLDNVVELNFGRHGLEEQESAARAGRRIGLGITGLADMYAAMGIQYDSEEALSLTDSIMNEKKLAEYNASIDLSIERGSFPLFDPVKHFNRGFCATLPEELKNKGREWGLRNIAISTIAPNGSLSIMAQCSGGIEPIFALKYKRYVEMGAKERKEFNIYHQGVARYFDVVGERDRLPNYWVVAHEVNHEYRVKLQSVCQKHIDASISSTINLPSDVSCEEVGNIYMEAWKSGLKGITVYREGSREGVLITDEFAKAVNKGPMDTITKCVRAEGGDKFYIMVSYENCEVTKPYQVFVMNYKKVEKDSFLTISDSLMKMLSENGVPEERIEKYLRRSKNSLARLTRFISLSLKTGYLKECVDILEEHAVAGTLAARLYNIFMASLDAKKYTCKNCKGNNVRMEEGCVHCVDCGWSGCN